MFLPNSHSFLLTRSVMSEPVIPSDTQESAISLLEPSSLASKRKMFLPNSHSFLLSRSVISKSPTQSDVGIEESITILPSSPSSAFGKKMFLPNSHSFLLSRSVISESIVQSNTPESAINLSISPSSAFGKKMFLPNSHSFLLFRSVISESVIQPNVQELIDNQEPTTDLSISPPSDPGKPAVGDKNKRTFLKVAGIAGASLAASLLLPEKAEAFIMGSSPTTGVVGVKNATNTRINPATEETVSTLLKPTDLSFDAGSLKVKVITSALPSSASTETTLQTISFGGFKFALRFATVGSIDYVGEAAIGTLTSAASWRIKRIDSTTGIIILWAGTGVFDQIWDNRASLSYS